jgi:hypothetical protein
VRNHCRVASATLECPLIQASLTRRGITRRRFQALKHLTKLTHRDAAQPHASRFITIIHRRACEPC